MKDIFDYLFICDMALPCGLLFLQCWKCKRKYKVRCDMNSIATDMMLKGEY